MRKINQKREEKEWGRGVAIFRGLTTNDLMEKVTFEE